MLSWRRDPVHLDPRCIRIHHRRGGNETNISYRQRVAEIERRLGRRRLVFFGTRGMDAQPLLALAPLAEIFSQIAPFDAVSVQETCLETLKKRRVDLDRTRRQRIAVRAGPDVHRLAQPPRDRQPFGIPARNQLVERNERVVEFRRFERFANRAPELIEQFKQRITEAVAYSTKHLEDMPEIRDWVWSEV